MVVECVCTPHTIGSSGCTVLEELLVIRCMCNPSMPAYPPASSLDISFTPDSRTCGEDMILMCQLHHVEHTW